MAKYGLLINYDYCTGCHSCEVACQQEHDFPEDKCGIKVTEYVYAALRKPVAIDYLWSFDQEIAVSNWDGSVGNYLFRNNGAPSPETVAASLAAKSRAGISSA